MTLLKVTNRFFLISPLIVVHSQFLTPEQLIEQYELSYGARTHYEMTGSRRTDMFDRVNPDYLLDGFFPFWSIILIGFSLIFLIMAVLGLIGYFLGCRRPSLEELYANEFDQQLPTDEDYLLAGQTYSNLNETKISIPATPNDYFNRNQRQDSTYESLLPEPRTRSIHAVEHMV